VTITYVFPCPLERVTPNGSDGRTGDDGHAIPLHGGKLVGYFMPPGGSRSVAWGLVAFDNLAAYQRYREYLTAHPDFRRELETEDPQERAYAEDVGLALAVHMLRRNGHYAGNGHRSGLTRTQLHNVIGHIHDNLARDLSLAAVATIAGIGPSHFKSLFKRSVGIPVHRYIIKCRVEHAVQLLSHGSAKLSEVAVQSGFADQSHMSRTMRRLIGMTPAAVKKAAS